MSQYISYLYKIKTFLNEEKFGSIWPLNLSTANERHFDVFIRFREICADSSVKRGPGSVVAYHEALSRRIYLNGGHSCRKKASTRVRLPARAFCRSRQDYRPVAQPGGETEDVAFPGNRALDFYSSLELVEKSSGRGFKKAILRIVLEVPSGLS